MGQDDAPSNARSSWADRVLARRREFAQVELAPGRDTIIRRDEILVSARDAQAVEQSAREWIDGVEYDEDAQLARLKLRPGRGLDPATLARELVERSANLPARWEVTPNHLMTGFPGTWGGGPADDPRSVEVVPVRARSLSAPARDVTVAVVDTGVSAHPWWNDSPWFGEVRQQDVELLDELPQDHLLDAQAGHGTFIIGVVLQRAGEVFVVAPKLLPSDGVTDELSVVRKLRRLRRWSTASGRSLDLVNLSFGGPTVDDQPSPHLASAVGELAADAVVVACAGNDGTTRPFWPAALDTVVAVGALDSDASDRAPFSNYGDWVDACAIGERVSSTFVTFNGPTPSTGDFDDDEFSGFARWSGTSFAAPKVVGAIAAHMLTNGTSAAESWAAVRDGGTPRAGLGVEIS